MGTNKQSGFTIIEVVLFLGLSSLMAILLLGGWTTMINTQRYKDSVKSTQSFLQQQYNLVYNVENGRDRTITCENGDVTEGVTDGIPRGQTSCVLMGRFIELRDGRIMNINAIVGREVNDDASTTDTESILQHDPSKITESTGLTDSRLDIPWQATVVQAGEDGNPRNIAIAIVRSPLTGLVHTYIADSYGDGAPPQIEEMVDTDNEREVTMCIDAGAPLTGGKMAVVIRKFASSQSFVETLDETATSC